MAKFVTIFLLRTEEQANPFYPSIHPHKGVHCYKYSYAGIPSPGEIFQTSGILVQDFSITHLASLKAKDKQLATFDKHNKYQETNHFRLT